jgi:hypothetical protein
MTGISDNHSLTLGEHKIRTANKERTTQDAPARPGTHNAAAQGGHRAVRNAAAALQAVAATGASHSRRAACEYVLTTRGARARGGEGWRRVTRADAADAQTRAADWPGVWGWTAMPAEKRQPKKCSAEEA